MSLADRFFFISHAIFFFFRFDIFIIVVKRAGRYFRLAFVRSLVGFFLVHNFLFLDCFLRWLPVFKNDFFLMWFGLNRSVALNVKSPDDVQSA